MPSPSGHSNLWRMPPRRSISLLPPGDSLQVACWKHTRLNFDDDDDEEFEPREWLSEARTSLTGFLQETGYPYLLEICDSYLLFMTRYCFDPSKAFASLSKSVFQRYMTSDSMRHGMLSTAALIRGYYDPKTPPALMFKQAEDFAATADKLAHLDMQRPDVPFEIKLGELSELMCYYYYAGRLGEYYNYLQLAAPIVSMLLGSNIDFHKLCGEETVDIRFFAWCDILGAVALSRPTMLTYVCDVEPLLQANREGRDRDDTDAGLEWIVGCPDVFTMLMVQIINLRQSRLAQPERMAQAARIEEVARAWIIRPTQTSNPLLRVERMAAQEIWRHAIILYLYNTIHKADPTNEVVRKSVKQVIDLASTLRSGRNPDCLLPVPYFIAATFATTPKDRHLLRTRLAGIGSEAYLDSLVATLDDLWKDAGNTGKHVDWSKKRPPTFMF
ncbi:hypothetical protein FS749_005804 [Ceratobasidium sp. UAMH 11750]|nr:hypothetical protein FS749_005804 [Ceratobasidium sp. UAMH 11750]